jgi:hypothetical protein
MSRETFLKKIDGKYQVVHEVEQTDVDLQYIQNKKEMKDILLRLQDIDIKRFKFIDGVLTVDEYEPFKQEAIDLRLRYNELEAFVLNYVPEGIVYEYKEETNGEDEGTITEGVGVDDTNSEPISDPTQESTDTDTTTP